MERNCTVSGRSFSIGTKELDLLDRLAPTFAGKRYAIPPPTLHPMERLRRRLSYRNIVYLYPHHDGFLTMFPPSMPFPVYEVERWYGDTWNALDYGREVDFSRPFLEQVLELRNVVPHLARSVIRMENSDYSNNCADLKNCYLVFNANMNEDSIACENLFNSRDCLDCTRIDQSELCYDCLDCRNCYNLQNCRWCENCADSYFIENCRGCTRCFGCANLRHKEYYIYNQFVGKKAYEAFLASLQLSSFHHRSRLWHQVYLKLGKVPMPHTLMISTENCSGNYLYRSRNVHDSMFVLDGENLFQCFGINDGAHNCLDISYFGLGLEFSYECSIAGLSSSNLLFCHECWEGCANLLYCRWCPNSKHCVGCVGLHRGQYCILNRQYSRDEYQVLAGRIVEHMERTGEWGEFFPIAMSDHAYNRSIAQRYFPLKQFEALKLGYPWYEAKAPDVSDAIAPDQLPDELPPDDQPLLVRSAESNKPFRLSSREIQKYRGFGAPLPRTTYDERLEARARSLGTPESREVRCAKSDQTILTTFPPSKHHEIWNREDYVKAFDS